MAPNLSRLQWVATDAVVALQLWRGHKLFDAISAHDVTEMGIAELGGTNAFLLLLYAASHFQRDTYRPFQVFIRYSVLSAGVQQLQQATDRLIDGIRVATRKCTAKVDSVL